jgi:hypothetical protein
MEESGRQNKRIGQVCHLDPLQHISTSAALIRARACTEVQVRAQEIRLGLQAEKNMHATSQHCAARCKELESQFSDSMQSTQSFVEQHVATALAKVKAVDGQQTNAQKVLRNHVDEKMQVLSRVMQARLEDISRDACERARCRSIVPLCTCQLCSVAVLV